VTAVDRSGAVFAQHRGRLHAVAAPSPWRRPGVFSAYAKDRVGIDANGLFRPDHVVKDGGPPA
jgi:hypothetical protein